ncbi:capsular biosynthesis protein [Calothrix sp. 336/3]|uniref:capsular biosynthesis protein n=1 Tax=Calothrix sp. 336/3 TaxID=1337936 RepID=UPI0004E2B4C7|nr:capsular biosynthesis protein [Calothrix sp. 336/3]AKG22689.1 capsular biosynthesis protein [Calothrix sp. 336/3]
MKPENFAERVIWYTCIGTYGFYFTGTIYLVGSVVGWILFYDVVRQFWQKPEKLRSIPGGIWMWIMGMVVMQVALVMGHLDFNLETGQIIKSSFGWAKGWALLAILPLAGVLDIRPQLLYRLACLIGLQTLIIFPFFLAAYLLHLPQQPITYPFGFLGVPEDFFSISLYGIDPSNHAPRWQLFTPWAPALGFMGNVYFFLALAETSRRWRYIGIFSAVFMCVISVSRLALLSIPIVWGLTWFLSHLHRPLLLLLLGLVTSMSGLIAPTVLDLAETAADKFSSARADSSRVRAALGRIALYRWENEAPIWGHGIVEKGPHLVEYMPIGSHHSWYGLLYVKGIVGLLALAIPMIYSVIDLVFKSQNSRIAQVGLSMTLILWLYTFGENLEVLAYLYWIALVMMGIAFKEKSPIFS